MGLVGIAILITASTVVIVIIGVLPAGFSAGGVVSVIIRFVPRDLLVLISLIVVGVPPVRMILIALAFFLVLFVLPRLPLFCLVLIPLALLLLLLFPLFLSRRL